MWQRLRPCVSRLQPCVRLQAAGCSRMPAGVLDGATHVYMANLCFPEALNHAMTTALAAVSPPPRRWPATSPRGGGLLPRLVALQPMRARGCRRMHWRLQPHVSEAASLTCQVASLRCVLTLRDLPLREAWPTDAKACQGRRLERVAEVSVGMSWADNVGVSYYCCSGARDG